MNTKWYLLLPKSGANWIKIQFCSSCEVAFNEMLIDILGTNARYFCSRYDPSPIFPFHVSV